MKESISYIRKCIAEINNRFCQYPSLFFNESDIQSELFALLLKKFGNKTEIKNTSVWGTNKIKKTKKCFTKKLHSELLLPNGRIDIVILDLDSIRFAMNSQGNFGYIQLEDGNHIFIEIKASRTNRSNISSKKKWYDLIASDIKKLNQYTHPCFILCFDFKNILDKTMINSLEKITKKNVELVYLKNKVRDNYLIK